MTSHFDGLPVSLNLVDGSSLEGVVRSVDAIQGTFKLDLAGPGRADIQSMTGQITLDAGTPCSYVLLVARI